MLYEVDGQDHFEIVAWSKHQRVDKPGKPRVPAPSLGKIREGLAKVAFEHHFTLAVGTFLPQVMAHAIAHEDGSTTSIMYLARDGHAFPSTGASAGRM